MENLIIFGKAKITAVKTGMTMHVTPDTIVRVDVKKLKQQKDWPPYTVAELRTWARKRFLEYVAQTFITSLRADPELRRRIGGTKWEAQMLHEEDLPSVHATEADIVPYYEVMVRGVVMGTKIDVSIFENVHHEEILEKLQHN